MKLTLAPRRFAGILTGAIAMILVVLASAPAQAQAPAPGVILISATTLERDQPTQEYTMVVVAEEPVAPVVVAAPIAPSRSIVSATTDTGRFDPVAGTWTIERLGPGGTGTLVLVAM